MKFKLLLRILILAIFFYLNGCGQNYDPELMVPDKNGKGYILTKLGCLVNGPWQTTSEHYNISLFLDSNIISSIAGKYQEMQRDLVFELHKNKTITYWFKSENIFSDTNAQNGIKRSVKNSEGYGAVKKMYTKGFWDVNFRDSTLIIHFDEKNIPEFNFKYVELQNGFANFQQIDFVDSVYNGKNVKLKRVNSMYYERLFPRF